MSPLNRRSPLKIVFDKADPKEVHKFTPEKYFGAHQDIHGWKSRYEAMLKRGEEMEEGIIQHPQFLNTYFYNGFIYLTKEEACSQ